MSTPITVIVSGATGFIAQHVVKQLLAKTIKSLVQLDQQPKVIIY